MSPTQQIIDPTHIPLDVTEVSKTETKKPQSDSETTTKSKTGSKSKRIDTKQEQVNYPDIQKYFHLSIVN